MTLFEFKAKVRRGEGCEMPANFVGALVVVYAAASDHMNAVRNGAAALANMHFLLEDVQGDVREIPARYWRAYVEKVWPEFTDRLPTQEHLSDLLETGAVFFGPFVGFEAE